MKEHGGSPFRALAVGRENRSASRRRPSRSALRAFGRRQERGWVAEAVSDKHPTLPVSAEEGEANFCLAVVLDHK